MITLKALKEAIEGILWEDLPKYIKGNSTLEETGVYLDAAHGSRFAQWLSDCDVLLYVPEDEAAQHEQCDAMLKCTTLDDLLKWVNAENSKRKKQVTKCATKSKHTR